ncbi:hypothetical protein AXE76_02605 [Gardnerella vaginalis]|uniref:Uncharacterized protein n=1 Tax=Gardnerella vaginalis TaxID=2702 RepID=A0A3E1IQZ9_GARVA|nr:hypothetical protein AXE76_02605 [Gardnerella vaginalis]
MWSAEAKALAAELAWKVHWTFQLSKLTLRVAFAHYALSAKAGRRANAGKIYGKCFHIPPIPLAAGLR